MDVSFSDNSHLGLGPVEVICADLVTGVWCLTVKMPRSEQRAFIEKWNRVSGICWHIEYEAIGGEA